MLAVFLVPCVHLVMLVVFLLPLFSFVFLLQEEQRKASVESVIDAIATKQRAGDRRTFDDVLQRLRYDALCDATIVGLFVISSYN